MKLTSLAIKDLEDIKSYTLENWGKQKWLQYYKEMIKVFKEIEIGEKTGRNRDLLHKDMRSVNYKSHIIFFKKIKAANNNLVILRIAHKKRLLSALKYYDIIE